jgi:hydroxyacyl-ACP dehydratase HTD2-like protein with hotdog domain
MTKSTTGNTHTRILRQSPVTLFRFSALTFNSHKIHYSLPWAQQVEGHRGLVVHGPLNLISILNFWRDVKGEKGGEPEQIVPESISYRATSPLYADEEYKIVLEEDGEKAQVNIYGPSGAVSMKADISG